MQLRIKNGLLQESDTVHFIPSPNYNERPYSTAAKLAQHIRLLVIHHISLPPHNFGSSDVIDFFTNCLDHQKHPFYSQIQNIKVSAHAFIRRNGEIIQFVNFNDRAWHAGTSHYQGQGNCNDFSIGIELEGDEKTPYRYAQYKVLAALTTAIIDAYPNIDDHIVGHEDIAPGRKTDPGPTFDWNKLHALL